MKNTQIIDSQLLVFKYDDHSITRLIEGNQRLSFRLNEPLKNRTVPTNRFSTFLVSAALATSSCLIASDIDKMRDIPIALEANDVLEMQAIKATVEPYIFKNRDEVNQFIGAIRGLKEFMSILPSLVSEVFGSVKMSLSVFNDVEENWKNLRIEIETNYPVEELSLLENKLFALFESKKIPDSVLSDITISCV